MGGGGGGSFYEYSGSWSFLVHPALIQAYIHAHGIKEKRFQTYSVIIYKFISMFRTYEQK